MTPRFAIPRHTPTGLVWLASAALVVAGVVCIAGL
jgi:hypothetical protein